MILTLIELVEHIKFVLQNEKRLVFSDNYRHYSLSENVCVRKSDQNNHLTLLETSDNYIGKELARIKPTFPSNVRMISVLLVSRKCAIHYYGIYNEITKEYTRNEIVLTIQDVEITFNLPVDKDEYFNYSLMHEIKVQYKEILAISELAPLLTKEYNCIVI